LGTPGCRQFERESQTPMFMRVPRSTRLLAIPKGPTMEILYERVAAIDVGKKIVAVAVRTPGERAGKRRQEVRKFNTFHQTLAEMVAWLVSERITHVTMEATGVIRGANMTNWTSPRWCRGGRVCDGGWPAWRWRCVTDRGRRVAVAGRDGGAASGFRRGRLGGRAVVRRRARGGGV